MKKTQNMDPVFFRLMVAYFFAKMASMQRTSVKLNEHQEVPINMYAINLAPSGSGKGHSIAILEEEVINGFREKFLNETYKEVAEINLARIANKRAMRDGVDPDKELVKVTLEFEEQGHLLFSFDSGTPAAIKQMRTKLLMAGAGSMNLEIDEIGSNMTGNIDVLNTFLELFDAGRIKQKLIKNTRENIRSEDLFGSTPTNMLLFGTPVKLLNGSKTEDDFYEMQEIGYARRSYYGFSRFRQAQANQTAQDLYDINHDPLATKYLTDLNNRFTALADINQFNQTLEMKKNVKLAWYDYRLECQKAADKMTEFQELRKAEISHRYFKVVKLAATYAFVDNSINITMDHLKNAIAMAEESGQAFTNILTRDRPHVKLAKYICTSGQELTQPDLMEDLPFYRGSEATRRDMMNQAVAYGYKNAMYIRTELVDGIQFYSGKKATDTNLKKIICAYGTRITEGYRSEHIPFDQMHKLITHTGYHWVNHFLNKGYRNEQHVIPGANVIVLDVEDSVSLDTAKMLLKEYTWLMHTTKRHTEKQHRFRIIMPLTHHVDLNEADFKEFMKNIFDWLPFSVDAQTGQRSRKWLTSKGKYWYNDGSLLETLQFVPKTKKAEDHQKRLSSQTNLSALERWYENNTHTGGRNKKLFAYAYGLVDLGYSVDDIAFRLRALNSKIPDPLKDAEITNTIMVSIAKLVSKRDSQ
jgi:hypothetical protein